MCALRETISDGGQLPAWVRRCPAAGAPFHAMRQDPTRHNLINLGAAALLWGAVLGVIAAGALLPWPLYVPLAGVLLGRLFFGHFILLVHECSHNMFVLSRDRARQTVMNRLLGRFAAGMFFTDYLKHWEEGHRIHHLRPCAPDDPQDAEPETGRALWRSYALLLIPASILLSNPSNRYGFSLRRLLAGLCFHVPLGAVGGTFIGWQVPAALLLALHVLAALNLTKKAQEHGAGLAGEPAALLRSRTCLSPIWQLISPFNINYHFEHHANFRVPWYLLPAYHRALLDIVPEPLHPYYFHRDFLAQLAGTKPLPPRDLLGILPG